MKRENLSALFESEDPKVFPYGKQDDNLKIKYSNIFGLQGSLSDRTSKVLFDKLFSVLALLITLPVWLMIFLAYLLDGFAHPEHQGSFFASYVSSSRGRKFLKHKFRLVKESLINQEIREDRDFRAYPSEHDKENLTCVGRFLKRHYLDEFPQIFNILKGDMSFVGPRPLAWHHYLRNVEDGNVTRKLLKAGLFSQTHVRKGTADFHNQALDFDYIEKYMKLPFYSLLWVDIKIIARGIKMILEGMGY